jgi:hypothetical protein
MRNLLAMPPENRSAWWQPAPATAPVASKGKTSILQEQQPPWCFTAVVITHAAAAAADTALDNEVPVPAKQPAAAAAAVCRRWVTFHWTVANAACCFTPLLPQLSL